MTTTSLSHNDKAAITEVLTRYATGIDRRDWKAFRTCFTKDCQADYGPIGVWSNAEDLTAWMENAHKDMGHTLHQLSNTVITGNTALAEARTYVDAVLTAPDGTTGHRALGFYDDELVFRAKGWKIARRKFTMVFFVNLVGGTAPDGT